MSHCMHVSTQLLCRFAMHCWKNQQQVLNNLKDNIQNLVVLSVTVMSPWRVQISLCLVCVFVTCVYQKVCVIQTRNVYGCLSFNLTLFKLGFTRHIFIRGYISYHFQVEISATWLTRCHRRICYSQLMAPVTSWCVPSAKLFTLSFKVYMWLSKRYEIINLEILLVKATCSVKKSVFLSFFSKIPKKKVY